MDAETSRWEQRAGLCASCVHAQVVTSSRGSVFRLCRRSFTDPRFPRYPQLPVLACDGYDAKPIAEILPSEKR
jgi:hypothetical protein